MSHVTELATAQLTATDQLPIELVEADKTPAVIIIRWPSKSSVIIRTASHPPLTLRLGSLPLPSSGWHRSSETVGFEPILRTFKRKESVWQSTASWAAPTG